MLKNKQVVFHVKRYVMSNVYISADENIDLIDNLTPAEHKLYSIVKRSIMINPKPEYFDNGNLANEIGVNTNTLAKLRSNLKTKGYLLITKFKDEDGDPMVRVVVGKDQVALYNKGIKVEITNAKQYKEMINKYDLLNPSLSKDELADRIDQANKEYSE